MFAQCHFARSKQSSFHLIAVDRPIRAGLFFPGVEFRSDMIARRSPVGNAILTRFSAVSSEPMSVAESLKCCCAVGGRVEIRGHNQDNETGSL